MEHIIQIATWLLIFQVVIIVFFAFVVYGIKFYRIMMSGSQEKLAKDVREMITFHIKNNGELTSEDIVLLKKNMQISLEAAEYFDEKLRMSPEWRQVRSQIIDRVFSPTITSYYQSHELYDRYFAAKMLHFHLDEKNIPIVLALIKDPVYLVSIEASMVGFKFPSQILINSAIDEFATERRIRQSIFASIASLYGRSAEKFIINKLFSENNPYTKAFCYRLLLQINPLQDLSKSLPHDLKSNEIELRMAALNYAAFNPDSRDLIATYLNDHAWEMRAAAARLMGDIKDTAFIPALEKALRDSEWWVRIRAAQSLGKLGEEGSNVLRAQSAVTDKLAFEAANQVLLAEAISADTLSEGL